MPVFNGFLWGYQNVLVVTVGLWWRVETTGESAMPEMLCQKDAALMLGVSWETLRQYRRRGAGPNWFRVANNVVRYRKSDVEAYLESRRVVTAA